MILTAEEIAEISRLLDQSRFSQLRLEIGDFKLRISRSGGRSMAAEEEEEAAAPEAPAPSAASSTEIGGPGPGEEDIRAPLLGNFYQSPRPGDPPFVQPGDEITPDTVIGIIEVMKLMNSVRAGVSGTVVAHLAANGTAVEQGQPLIRVKKQG